jgi:hypothetical protein
VYRQQEYDADPWTVEEMNLLADEANALISQSESAVEPNKEDG